MKTPNIDRLAREGVKLTDFYANGADLHADARRPHLRPLSAALRDRVAAGGATSRDSVRGLPATGHSLPHLLADNGYATALVGKWHLGYKPEFSPGAHGFDYFFGFKSGFTDYYQHTDGDGPRPICSRTTRRWRSRAT